MRRPPVLEIENLEIEFKRKKFLLTISDLGVIIDDPRRKRTIYTDGVRVECDDYVKEGE